MARFFIHISAVEVLRTGADGGHVYVKGRGVVPGHEESDIYAFFRTLEDEADFNAKFRGEDVTVTTESVEFIRGIGAYLKDCRLTAEEDIST